MNSRIERLEAFGIQMPLVGAFTSGGITKDATKCVVVRITAADGTVGISSVEPSASAKSPGTAPELLATIRDRIGPAVVGLDALNLNRLTERLEALAPTQPGAAAGVEMACVELAARLLGVHPRTIYRHLESQAAATSSPAPAVPEAETPSN